MSLFDQQSDKALAEAPETRPPTGAPLAERMRPRSVEEFSGQGHIMDVGAPLRRAIESDTVGSIIFWGPPGTGKTTLARLIARATEGYFVTFSAVSASIKDVKAILVKARDYRNLAGRKTYIFIDEIHRFNKAQQDAFLPYVEAGDIVLLGATTENPSFEVNSALLSRCRVYTLNRLDEDDLDRIITQTLADNERGFGSLPIELDALAREFLTSAADGDARRLLGLLEAAVVDVSTDLQDASSQDADSEEAKTSENKLQLSAERLKEVYQRRVSSYDKSGEEHYNHISALHKTIRGGDPDAALYWLARMMAGGEDPKYLLRRLIRFASEDVGLADPNALLLAISTRESYQMLGSPEGDLAIAQLVIYLACAPKSNAAYLAWKKAQGAAESAGSLPVPKGIRNAPTKLMKTLGYGKDYKYAHDYAGAVTDQEYFPSELAGTEFYKPTGVGRESKIADYLKWYRQERSRLMKTQKQSHRNPEPKSDSDV